MCVCVCLCVSAAATDGSRIVQIATSKGRSAAVLADGRLFVWGHKLMQTPVCINPPGNSSATPPVQSVALCGDSSKTCVLFVSALDQSVWAFGDVSSRVIGRAASFWELKQATPTRITGAYY